jgi:hypothetical protein
MEADMRRYLTLWTILAAALLALASSPPAAAQGAEAPAESYERFIGPEPETFEDVAALVEAFTSRLAAGDVDGLAKLLGLDLQELQSAEEDLADHVAEIGAWAAEGVRVEETAPDRRTLLLGHDIWPFPFPVVQVEGKWAFDTGAGLEEVVNRRIGENELQAIATAHAYVEAQEEYRETDWDGDGVLEYARKLISTPENYDGLYWPAAQGVPESPAGAFVDAADEDPADGSGYFGYRYRILESQGENVAGGEYDYVINDNMIAGFALIAWPVEYDATGVHTFMVSHHGTVYEKDFGPDTAAEVEKITSFNPDQTWSLPTNATQ